MNRNSKSTQKFQSSNSYKPPKSYSSKPNIPKTRSGFPTPAMVSQLASSPIDAKLIYVQKYYETQEALEKEKETFKTKEAIFKRKENELREKDLKIQESLIKFSKYLEENEIKKHKAEEKKEFEGKEIEKIDEAILEMENQLQEVEKRSADIENQVAEMQVYEQILKEIAAKNPDEYNDISDVINSR